MDTIIDGYNLIFAWGWLRDPRQPAALEKSRQRLIRELAARIPAESRETVTIVFDAKTVPIKEAESELTISGFHIRFAQHHDEADSLIEELIGRHAKPRGLTVVSGDNRLKTAAKRRKAISIDSVDWLDELERRQRTSHRSSSELRDQSSASAKERAIEELAETDWLAEFGLDDDADSDEKSWT